MPCAKRCHYAGQGLGLNPIIEELSRRPPPWRGPRRAARLIFDINAQTLNNAGIGDHTSEF